MARAVIATALALVAAGCVASDDDGAAAKDGAGSWRTWVLDSPGEVRAGSPPAEAEDEKGVEAVRPWLDQAMLLVSRRPKDPVTASRNYALAAVAMNDAAVAAEHWGFQSPDAAIAGAASRVIAYAFPEFPAARLDQDAEAAAAGDSAGLELGRDVAERVIAWGKGDGSDREWHGELPSERGAWRPPPGSAARPVQPLGGTWRTWILRSGDEVRSPPPPGYTSAEFREEARKVLEVRANLTDEQKRIAEFWAGGEGTELPPGRWIKVTLEYLRDHPAMSSARAARLFALLCTAMADAGVAAWDTKYAYWVTRPINAIRDLGLDPDWTPYLDTPFFPAYVSGHAAYSGAAAEVLAHLFPEDADLWNRRADEAAASRVYGGIHYWMDGEYGLKMGREIGRRAVALAKQDGADR